MFVLEYSEGMFSIKNDAEYISKIEAIKELRMDFTKLGFRIGLLDAKTAVEALRESESYSVSTSVLTQLANSFGQRVEITLLSGKKFVHHNVTGIFWNFPSQSAHVFGEMVAFESSIHHTGINYRLSDVVAFESTQETIIADSFDPAH